MERAGSEVRKGTEEGGRGFPETWKQGGFLFLYGVGRGYGGDGDSSCTTKCAAGGFDGSVVQVPGDRVFLTGRRCWRVSRRDVRIHGFIGGEIV